MARSTTTLVTCPSALYAPCGGKCGGQQVTMRRGTSKGRRTVKFGPCAFIVAQGWTGDLALVLWEDHARDHGLI
jgi:hypothetical protein